MVKGKKLMEVDGFALLVLAMAICKRKIYPCGALSSQPTDGLLDVVPEGLADYLTSVPKIQ
jgi:hypothetical protein